MKSIPVIATVFLLSIALSAAYANWADAARSKDIRTQDYIEVGDYGESMPAEPDNSVDYIEVGDYAETMSHAPNNSVDYIEVGDYTDERPQKAVLVTAPVATEQPPTDEYIQLTNSTIDGGAIDPNANRIVGGYKTRIKNFPWQLALFARGSFQCGASIISKRWALTAAHCVESRNIKYAVRAGSSYFKRGGQVRRVVLIARHSGYNTRTMVNDIAVLKLNKAFRFNRYVKTVNLPATNKKPSLLKVSGWGTLSENGWNLAKRLRAVRVKKIRKSVCRRAYNRINISIKKTMFCAAASGRDSCQGDSGGPLVSNRVQYGVVSFGQGCARRKYAGVYTNVYKYRSWIKRVLNSY